VLNRAKKKFFASFCAKTAPRQFFELGAERKVEKSRAYVIVSAK
jgi:hypothetical protein